MLILHNLKVFYYLESKWSAFWQALDRYTHNTYFFFVRILVLDAWLLSRFADVRNRLREKGPRILWIALLPLLLLFGESHNLMFKDFFKFFLRRKRDISEFLIFIDTSDY